MTTQRVVLDLLKRMPFFPDFLEFFNLSSLAKRLQPEIEKKLLKKVETSTIIVALSRIRKKERARLQLLKSQLKEIFRGKIDLSVRLNLIELSISNSPSLRKKIQKVIELISKHRGYFLNVSQGILETTIVFNQMFEKSVLKILSGEKIAQKMRNLSSLSIKIPQEAIYLPGVYYCFLRILFLEGINLIEVISTFRELNLILKEEDTERALFSIKKAFL